MKTILGIIVIGLLFTVRSHAQTKIYWSHINSGSSPSGNGSVLINGSIGGVAIGASSADTMMSTSGFWTGVPAPLFSEIPFLNIQLTDGSKLQLSWPVTAEGFSLERATVLSPPDWGAVKIDPEINQGLKIIREEAVGMNFYRLKKE